MISLVNHMYVKSHMQVICKSYIEHLGNCNLVTPNNELELGVYLVTPKAAFDIIPF
jgi:hypothetical protein